MYCPASSARLSRSASTAHLLCARLRPRVSLCSFSPLR